MNPPALISGLGEVAGRYDAVLSDVWGVIHNGQQSFPSAVEALQRFNAERGPVVLISNAPRPAHAVIPQLRGLNVPDDAWTDFVTSGDVTRAELERRADAKVWRIGPPRDDVLFEGIDLDFVEPDDAEVVCCTGPFETDGVPDAPEKYTDVFRRCTERGLTMICANPDRVVHRGSELIWCAGALAELYEDLGGVVIMGGKPYPPIFSLARDRIAAARDSDDAGRLILIGDAVVTDVKGANAQDIDCLFVAGGIHGAEAVVGGKPVAAAVQRILLSEGAHAAYVSGSLSW